MTSVELAKENGDMTVADYVKQVDLGGCPDIALIDKAELSLISIVGTIRPFYGKFLVKLRKELAKGFYQVIEQSIVDTKEEAEEWLGIRGYFANLDSFFAFS